MKFLILILNKGVKKIINNPILDPQLLKRFRDYFNSSNFGFTHFQNRNGKNDFVAICSSMDWLSISIDHINNLDLPYSNSNNMSMKIFTFIMAVDMVYC